MDEEFTGISWGVSGHPEVGRLDIVKWPHHKQVSVNLTHGSESQPLAYFTKDEYAEQFIVWLRKLLSLCTLSASNDDE